MWGHIKSAMYNDNVTDQLLLGLTRLRSPQGKQGERPAIHDEVNNEHTQIHTSKNLQLYFLLCYIPYPSSAL
jgi:hypothetical protein